MADMKRLGRADDVTMMVFSEFGRRVGENANLGTDHGTAGPVFVIGPNYDGRRREHDRRRLRNHQPGIAGCRLVVSIGISESRIEFGPSSTVRAGGRLASH